MGRWKIYGNKDPREIPTYGITEAAHYLLIPTATLRSWVKGRTYPVTGGSSRFFQPPIQLSPNERLLSFVNLIEAHVLNALRKTHGVPLFRIRAALEYLSTELDSPHPLADERLKTDGINLFIENLGQTINLSQHGQLALRELLQDHLQRIEHDPVGFAARLYPFTRLNPKGSPKSIVIDPQISFGKPVIADTGIPTSALLERFEAGESISDLVEDYALNTLQIEEAIRYQRLQPAA